MKIFKWQTFSSHENGSTPLSNTSDSICTPEQQPYIIIWSATIYVCLALVFPSFIAILKELARRRWCSKQPGHGKSTNASSSSSDILLCNLVVFSIAGLLYILMYSLVCFGVNLPRQLLMVCFIANMVGGPFGGMAVSLDCYLAVVHPVMYMVVKRSWRFPLVLGTLNWLYTAVLAAVIVANDLKMYSAVLLVPIFMLMPPYIFLNISTLRTLRLAGPKRRRLADLSPAKRQAFWQILVILFVSLLYTCPLLGILMYQALSDVDEQTIFCQVMPLVMTIPALSGTIIFLVAFFTTCRH